jgi:hypothetical protein
MSRLSAKLQVSAALDPADPPADRGLGREDVSGLAPQHGPVVALQHHHRAHVPHGAVGHRQRLAAQTLEEPHVFARRDPEGTRQPEAVERRVVDIPVPVVHVTHRTQVDVPSEPACDALMDRTRRDAVLDRQQRVRDLERRRGQVAHLAAPVADDDRGRVATVVVDDHRAGRTGIGEVVQQVRAVPDLGGGRCHDRRNDEREDRGCQSHGGDRTTRRSERINTDRARRRDRCGLAARLLPRRQPGDQRREHRPRAATDRGARVLPGHARPARGGRADRRFAVAAFTTTEDPAPIRPEIDASIGTAARIAVDALLASAQR